MNSIFSFLSLNPIPPPQQDHRASITSPHIVSKKWHILKWISGTTFTLFCSSKFLLLKYYFDLILKHYFSTWERSVQRAHSHISRYLTGWDPVSVLGGEEGYTEKYGLSPMEFPRELPRIKAIFWVLPSRVLIRTLYNF